MRAVIVVLALALNASAFTPSTSVRLQRLHRLKVMEVEETAKADEAVPPSPPTPPPVPRQSAAIPFMKAPLVLDGSLAADMGFDPLGFADSRENLLVYREAEVKHARLAMLAAAGWPLAEIFHKGAASTVGLPSILNVDGRNPSVLNGFTGAASALGVVAAFSLVGLVEGATVNKQYIAPQDFSQRVAAFEEMEKKGMVSGDFAFDPLNLYNFFGAGEKGRETMRTAEIKNGRLAMMAITGMAVQEAVFKKPVVEQTPLFFKPVWESVAEVLTGDSQPIYTEEGLNTKFGTSAPLESFKYPDAATEPEVSSAPAATGVLESATAPVEVPPPVEDATAALSSAPAPAGLGELDFSEAPAAVASSVASAVEAPAAVASSVAEAAQTAAAAVADSLDLPSTAEVAGAVASTVEKIADAAPLDFSQMPDLPF